MVWALFPIDSLRGVQKYHIFSQGTYKVGRKGCDVIVQTDTSISRIHAEIIVEKMVSRDPLEDNTASSRPSYVKLKDCSKYGTSVNRETEAEVTRLKKDQEVTLKDGDLVTFGTGNATFRFAYVPLVLFHLMSSRQLRLAFQAKASAIGAFATTKWSPECTHVIVEKTSAVTSEVIDAVIAKKPILLGEWLEVLAEQSICTEMPSSSSYLPDLVLDGTSIMVVEPKFREKVLEGYTLVMGSSTKYKFKNKLQLLFEVAGAKCISTVEFSSSSQTSAVEENRQFILVISSEATNEFSHLRELSSLSRVTEVNLIASILTGKMDTSIIEQAPYVVSSSHSTDETIVADSDLEGDTVTSSHVGTKDKPQVSSNDDCKEKIADTDYLRSDTVTSSHVGTKDKPQVSSNDDCKEKIAETDYLRSDMVDIKSTWQVVKDQVCVDDVTQNPTVNTRIKENRDFHIPATDASIISVSPGVDFRGMNKTTEIDQTLADRHENSDILYSQDLIVRKTNISHPRHVRSETVNFKRFKKRDVVSGNSFRNLVSFSKDPYKESDFGGNGTLEYIKEERKRKQMEAIAEDLFNNEKPRKRATPGVSLDTLFARR